METEMLRKLQDVETDMLVVVDEFCRRNSIKYSLAYGTLLGAVRHHGPIPWDDDVDICMMRADYERFILLWKESGMDGYYLQETGKNTSSNINHAKIRKNNTVLASDEEFIMGGHQGIWIDVFAMDKIPNNKKLQKKMLFWAKIRLVYTRDYPLKNKGKFLYLLSKMMLMLPKSAKKWLRNYSEDYVTQYKNWESGYRVIGLAAPVSLGELYPENIMDEFVELDYCGHKLLVVKQYDKMLKIAYGNYMEMPPVEERICRHNPTHVQF